MKAVFDDVHGSVRLKAVRKKQRVGAVVKGRLLIMNRYEVKK